MTRTIAQAMAVLLASACLWGCAKSSGGPTVGSGESHFLVTCDDTCPEGLLCLCGVCTSTCSEDDACSALSDAASCLAPAAEMSGCLQTPTGRTCDIECEGDQDCDAHGDGFTCEAGRCRKLDEGVAGNDVMPPSLGPACVTHADCGDGMVCGYPIADGCSARGECLSIGDEGDVSVTGPEGFDFPGGQHCACQGGAAADLRLTRRAGTPSTVDISHTDHPSDSSVAGTMPCPGPTASPLGTPPSPPTGPPTFPVARLQCPAPITCDDADARRLPVQLRIDEAPELERFVAIDGSYILADLKSEPMQSQVVLSWDPARGPLRYLPLPSSPLGSPLLVSDISVDDARVVVLQCDLAQCVVWGLENDSFSPLTTFTVQDLGEQRLAGISNAHSGPDCARPYPFCVYGLGIHCYDGNAWTTELSNRTARVRDMRGSGCETLVAAQDDGRVYQWDVDLWYEQPIMSQSEALLSIATHGSRFTVSMANGQLLEGTSSGMLACPSLGVSLSAMYRIETGFGCGNAADPEGALALGFDTYVIGLSSDGRLVQTAPTSYECRVPEVWSCGPQHPGAIGLGVYTCGAAHNPLIVTPDTVYGTDDCLTGP